MKRRVTVALICATVATLVPTSGATQQLLLTADVGKTEFFEDEPVYLLLRLQNVGTDTAWTYFFSLFSPAITLSVRLGHGHLVEVSKPILDYRLDPSWRGEPVPPGASSLKTMVLQDIMGDEWDLRAHLFAHHLASDQYELHVTFHAHLGVPHTTTLTLEAAPIVFQIRARTSSEEKEVRQLEAMRYMGWDTTRVAGRSRAEGYHASLIQWVEQRWRDQPDDPFLPFLLYNGLSVVGKVLEEQIVAGKVPRFDPDTSAIVSRLRLGVLERNKRLPAGAHLVQGMSARHRGEFQTLTERLGPSPAADMARYQIWLGPYWP